MTRTFFEDIVSDLVFTLELTASAIRQRQIAKLNQFGIIGE
jgi:hypothetical protein